MPVDVDLARSAARDVRGCMRATSSVNLATFCRVNGAVSKALPVPGHVDRCGIAEDDIERRAADRPPACRRRCRWSTAPACRCRRALRPTTCRGTKGRSAHRRRPAPARAGTAGGVAVPSPASRCRAPRRPCRRRQPADWAAVVVLAAAASVSGRRPAPPERPVRGLVQRGRLRRFRRRPRDIRTPRPRRRRRPAPAGMAQRAGARPDMRVGGQFAHRARRGRQRRDCRATAAQALPAARRARRRHRGAAAAHSCARSRGRTCGREAWRNRRPRAPRPGAAPASAAARRRRPTARPPRGPRAAARPRPRRRPVGVPATSVSAPSVTRRPPVAMLLASGEFGIAVAQLRRIRSLGAAVAQLALDAHAERQRFGRRIGLLHDGLHQRARFGQPPFLVRQLRQAERGLRIVRRNG